MRTRSNATRYSNLSVTLHWIIAFLVLWNYLLGRSIGSGLKGHSALERIHALSVLPMHETIGIAVLLLSMMRVGWRLMHGFPPLPAATPKWQAALARANHIAFYIFMIGMPLAGWAMASGSKLPLSAFGYFAWPRLPVDMADAHAAQRIHQLLGRLLPLLVLLHIVGVIRHTVIRDRLIWRMLPSRAGSGV